LSNKYNYQKVKTLLYLAIAQRIALRLMMTLFDALARFTSVCSTSLPKQAKFRAWAGLISSALLLLHSHGAQAQADTIRLADRRLCPANLRPGVRQYLVFFQNPKQQQKLGFQLWLRDIRRTEHHGEAVFSITQHWYSSDTSSYRTVFSLNRAADFAPLYHAETVHNKLKAYNWNLTGIAGADSVATNQAKDFRLAFARPNFNWNLDIETFEMLPLAAGKSFAINFYDAGLSPPAYITYKVTGSEVLALPGSGRIDCWKLYTAGKTPTGMTFSETFWISKKTHEFLKEEDAFNGSYRYKIRTSTVPDSLLQRFE
jgi:hypothetical protein